jgi:anti-sigma28 factor (negative regulator of flagellin synthesis)
MNLMVSSMQADNPNSPDADSIARAARLEALRRAIAEGTYKIPSDHVADKIIEDMIRKP